MSLTASTVTLFLALIPGLLFRHSLYHGTLIKRPFYSSTTIYSSIAVLLYSLIVFILYIGLIKILIFIWNKIFPHYDLKTVLVEFNGTLYLFVGTRRYELINYIVNYPIISIILFICMCALAVVIAKTIQKIAKYLKFASRYLYGPLSTIMMRDNPSLITCFVLTKINHDRKRLMYAGFPEEISLREGNNIDHIVISNPEKFYIKLNDRQPITTINSSRSISSSELSTNIMYINGAEIENVHFEGFYF